MKFYILNLGCPKNEVDGEGMQQVLRAAGHQPVLTPLEADALIVNTCGFIEKAKEESLDQLRLLAKIKRRTKRGPATAPERKLLIAAGCLSERYAKELERQIPELDGVLGTRRWAEIDTLLTDAGTGNRPCWTGEGRAERDGQAASAGGRASAYIKIADGCDATCTFCAIPSIKGPQRSRGVASIIEEARQLAGQGVKEIVLIAQDTTAYGRDRGESEGLAGLLECLVDEVHEIPWIRLMYAYPAHISDRLLRVIAKHPSILRYLDLPLQHADEGVLKRMRRPLNGRQVVERLREALPGLALRSAFIVGFPGETEKEFRTLLEFLDEMRFDRVGVFTYSCEEGTLAAGLSSHVSEKVKRSRFERAMALQQGISWQRNKGLVGTALEVLIEAAAGDESDTSYGAIGRSYRDAPEVDGLVFVRQALPAGELVRVKVTEALQYDLVGEAMADEAGGLGPRHLVSHDQLDYT